MSMKSGKFRNRVFTGELHIVAVFMPFHDHLSSFVTQKMYYSYLLRRMIGPYYHMLQYPVERRKSINDL